MGNLIRIFLFLLTLTLTSCFTVYTQKQTEQLSRVVYATKDSLESSRLDLAESYSQETVRLVSPPKDKIIIQAVINEKTNQRTVIVPEKHKNAEVIVVGSVRYQELLNNSTTANQLKKDYQTLTEQKKNVDEELIKKEAAITEMTVQVNTLNVKLSETSKTLLKYKFVLGALGALAVFYLYIKTKTLFVK